MCNLFMMSTDKERQSKLIPRGWVAQLVEHLVYIQEVWVQLLIKMVSSNSSDTDDDTVRVMRCRCRTAPQNSFHMVAGAL